ncbi:hypothetical protein EVAR_40678_1 [Eumeta japonica]|uniref:Uncharacterized protein n=1 Tax=Eumeta variegata TaxID=151549 RepID=A0A4C1X803_EUMVA|nr:hypothetical protein EVAR_40678_1 [Eumeta japonica]
MANKNHQPSQDAPCSGSARARRCGGVHHLYAREFACDSALNNRSWRGRPPRRPPAARRPRRNDRCFLSINQITPHRNFHRHLAFVPVADCIERGHEGAPVATSNLGRALPAYRRITDAPVVMFSFCVYDVVLRGGGPGLSRVHYNRIEGARPEHAGPPFTISGIETQYRTARPAPAPASRRPSSAGLRRSRDVKGCFLI